MRPPRRTIAALVILAGPAWPMFGCGTREAQVVEVPDAPTAFADAAATSAETGVAPPDVAVTGDAPVDSPRDAAAADAPVDLPRDVPVVDAPVWAGCMAYRCPLRPPPTGMDGGAGAPFAGRWQLTTPAGAGPTLRDLWVPSDDEAWAVGDQGTALHLEGSTWRSVATGTSVMLNTVAGSARDDVWAGGDGATLLHWDGVRWSTSTLPSAVQSITDIAVVSRREAYLIADRRRPYRFDGGAWTAMADPSTSFVAAVYSPGPGRVWLATGFSGVITWNGSGWVSNFETADFGRYTAIHGSGPDDVWAVGNGSGLGPNSKPAYWNGTTWKLFAVPVEPLSGVWSRHARDAWLSDRRGRIWHWDGDGLTRLAVVASPLHAIAGAPDGRVWAVGDGGDIWIYQPEASERCERAACVAAPSVDAGAPRNACGGSAPIGDTPGAACRPCGWHWSCAEIDRVVCAGFGAMNSCGGCRRFTQPKGDPFPQYPGGSCGAGHWYVCQDADNLSCTSTRPQNDCGGSAPLAHPVGERCGSTADCRYACRGQDTYCLCDKRDAGG